MRRRLQIGALNDEQANGAKHLGVVKALDSKTRLATESCAIFRSSAGEVDDGPNMFGATFDVGCRRIDVAVIVEKG